MLTIEQERQSTVRESQPVHCVSLHISGGDVVRNENRKPVDLDCIESSLRHAVNKARVGDFDGSEVGDGYTALYMYGPSADCLFEVIQPILAQFDWPAGSHAFKRYGGPPARRVRIEAEHFRNQQAGIPLDASKYGDSPERFHLELRQLAYPRLTPCELICYPKKGTCILEFRCDVLPISENEGSDYFYCLNKLRRKLEPKGWLICCNGSRKSFWPSGMARDMGAALKGYLLAIGRKPSQIDLVDTFAPSKIDEISSLSTQHAFIIEWLESMGHYEMADHFRAIGLEVM